MSIVNLESIFPVKSEKLKDIAAEENYKKIVEFFEENLNKIDYKLNFYVDGLISLFEEAFSFVPASTLGNLTMYLYMIIPGLLQHLPHRCLNFMKTIRDCLNMMKKLF